MAEEKEKSGKAVKGAPDDVKKSSKKAKSAGKLAAVRVRGLVNVSGRKKGIMGLLRIYKKNSCSVVDDTPSMRGMLKKVEDRITWGEIDDSTVKELQEKRGKEGGKTFFLSPPRGGFERKGIKAPYSIGGALGYRGSDIVKLIKRMI